MKKKVSNVSKFIKLQVSVLFLTENDPVNRTKLNKLLFFADSFSILKTDNPITGVDYFKYPYGPVPEEINDLRKYLVDTKQLCCRREEGGIYYEYFYWLNKEKIDLKKIEGMEYLTEDEINNLKDVRDKLTRYNAATLSDLSHKFSPWREASHKIDLNKVKEDWQMQEWFKKSDLNWVPLDIPEDVLR